MICGLLYPEVSQSIIEHYSLSRITEADLEIKSLILPNQSLSRRGAALSPAGESRINYNLHVFYSNPII